MATSRFRKTGAAVTAKADGKRSGFNVDPGPYEAIVQGHVQGSRMGQLIVTIPDWGGINNVFDSAALGDGTGSTSNQIVVSYASPFYGSTYGADTGINANTPQTAGQSYGMWCIPPDVGNKVLVTFVSGDMNRGYWFACVYDSPSHHMVPANGRNIGGPGFVAPIPASDGVVGITDASILPVVEADVSDPKLFTATGLTDTPRFPHEIQTKILMQQGLDQDKIRGAISSSSMRESPSNVYGISTPGRSPTTSNQVKNNSQAVYFRQGGHSFVMDDGADGTGQDPVGTDQLIRLRTSGGHQLLMNDTEGILYVAAASGSQWMEFSSDGTINVYAANGYNLRSSGDINFHSDTGIHMCAPTIDISAIPSLGSTSTPSISLSSSGTVDVVSITEMTLTADTSLKLNSIGTIDLLSGSDLTMGSAATATLGSSGSTVITGQSLALDGSMLYLNSNPSNIQPIIPPVPVVLSPPNMLPDTLYAGAGWINNGLQVPSTCTVAPAHEPWVVPGTTQRPPAYGPVGVVSTSSKAVAATQSSKAIAAIASGVKAQASAKAAKLAQAAVAEAQSRVTGAANAAATQAVAQAKATATKATQTAAEAQTKVTDAIKLAKQASGSLSKGVTSVTAGMPTVPVNIPSIGKP